VDLAVEMLQGRPCLRRRTILHICLDTLFGLVSMSEMMLKDYSFLQTFKQILNWNYHCCALSHSRMIL